MDIALRTFPFEQLMVRASSNEKSISNMLKINVNLIRILPIFFASTFIFTLTHVSRVDVMSANIPEATVRRASVRGAFITEATFVLLYAKSY